MPPKKRTSVPVAKLSVNAFLLLDARCCCRIVVGWQVGGGRDRGAQREVRPTPREPPPTSVLGMGRYRQLEATRDFAESITGLTLQNLQLK